ncbi:uncharacterized protein LTR77_001790 [Saxophila tyrrhenica]|uniref:Uncharacterized protein n=1 Tax=Saxophila tyrrhenica TaxID=1690608 RepID=A0AAV9PL34_9PEZI|nr:hypothetical protein LTR77_001790 [Saxophila tyrrhenica]
MTALIDRVTNRFWPAAQEAPSWDFSMDVNPPREPPNKPPKTVTTAPADGDSLDDDDSIAEIANTSFWNRNLDGFSGSPTRSGRRSVNHQHSRCEGMFGKLSGHSGDLLGRKRELPADHTSARDNLRKAKRARLDGGVGEEKKREIDGWVGGMLRGVRSDGASRNGTSLDRAKASTKSLNEAISPPHLSTTFVRGHAQPNMPARTPSGGDLDRSDGLGRPSNTAKTHQPSLQTRETSAQKSTSRSSLFNASPVTPTPARKPEQRSMALPPPRRPSLLPPAEITPGAARAAPTPLSAFKQGAITKPTSLHSSSRPLPAMKQPTIIPPTTNHNTTSKLAPPSQSSRPPPTWTLLPPTEPTPSHADGTITRPCFIDDDSDSDSDNEEKPSSPLFMPTQPEIKVEREATAAPRPRNLGLPADADADEKAALQAKSERLRLEARRRRDGEREGGPGHKIDVNTKAVVAKKYGEAPSKSKTEASGLNHRPVDNTQISSKLPISTSNDTAQPKPKADVDHLATATLDKLAQRVMQQNRRPAAGHGRPGVMPQPGAAPRPSVTQGHAPVAKPAPVQLKPQQVQQHAAQQSQLSNLLGDITGTSIQAQRKQPPVQKPRLGGQLGEIRTTPTEAQSRQASAQPSQLSTLLGDIEGSSISDAPALTNAGAIAKQHVGKISQQHPPAPKPHPTQTKPVEEKRLRDAQHGPLNHQPKVQIAVPAEWDPTSTLQEQPDQQKADLNAQINAIKERTRTRETNQQREAEAKEAANELVRAAADKEAEDAAFQEAENALNAAEVARESERIRGEQLAKKRKEQDAANEAQARRRYEAKAREEERLWEAQRKAKKVAEERMRKAKEAATKKAAEDERQNSALSKLMSAAPQRPASAVSQQNIGRPMTKGPDSAKIEDAPQQKPAPKPAEPSPTSGKSEVELARQARIQQKEELKEKRRKQEEEAANEELVAEPSPPPAPSLFVPTRKKAQVAAREESVDAKPVSGASSFAGRPVSLNSAAGAARLANAKKSHGRQLGQISPKDVSLVRLRHEKVEWPAVMSFINQKYNDGRCVDTLRKRARQVKEAIDAAGTGITKALLGRVEAGDFYAQKELNKLVHGNDHDPAAAGQRPRDANGHFLPRSKAPTLSPQKAASPIASPSPQKARQHSTDVQTPEESAEDQDTMPTHPIQGGKELTAKILMQWYDESEDHHKEELAWARGEREPSPFTPQDYNYYVYGVWRREISAEELEEGDELEDKEWMVCDDDYEDKDWANLAAGQQSTRFTDPRSAMCDMTQGNSVTNEYDKHGMRCSTMIINGGGMVQARVMRQAKNYSDGIPPTSKEGWLSPIVWIVMQQIIKRSGADDMFEVSKETNTTSVAYGEIFSVLERANVQAAKRFVNLTFTPQDKNLNRRDEEIADEVDRLVMALDADEDETLDETFESKDGTTTVRVWVEQNQLKGPRNC